MQSIITALNWEYFARNRWMLILVPFLSSGFALITLLPLRGVDLSHYPQRDLISIYMINVLCLITTISVCVMGTQGSMSQFYLKPISTTSIVNFYYWVGAFVVACQVALVLWIWRNFFVSDWPIIFPVLFAVVFWGAFQPIFRGSSNSFSLIIVAPVVFFVLCFWLKERHGIPVQRGGMPSAQAHYWDSVSGRDGLIAITTLCISYVLTLWRVNYDRSRRCRQTLTDRVRDFFAYMDARSNTYMRLFTTPVHAQAWYAFQDRMITIPSAVLVVLPCAWLLAIVVGATSQNLGAGLAVAWGGTMFAAIVQIIPAFLLSLIPLMGQSVNQDILTGKLISIEKPRHLGMTSYLFSLPISDSQRAQAILRSSAWACGIASAVIVLSFAVAIGLSWCFGSELSMRNNDAPVKLGVLVPWSLVVVCGGAMLLSFVLATLVCRFDFRKWDLRDWLTPVILVSVVLAAATPIALSLSMVLCRFLAGFLVYAIARAVINKDISWGGAVRVGLAGGACATGLFLGLPEELGLQGLVLGLILIMLAMLPFFTTAAAIRDLRTT